jgi:hypothetical protein
MDEFQTKSTTTYGLRTFETKFFWELWWSLD